MMGVKVESGRVVFRRWDGERGLQEIEVPFNSVEDLFELCLDVDDPRLVDRVIIEGKDDLGKPHVVTFVFQSMLVSPGV